MNCNYGNSFIVKIANGMMNEFLCATIVDCHGNKHFSALMANGGLIMPDNALTWMMNDPYCIVAMAVVISGCIVLAVDCWRKWH